MKILNEETIKRALFEVYHGKLIRALNESDITDKDGKVVLSKDLKVTDIKTGFEYTINRVVDKNSKRFVVLNPPDAPRFKPPPEALDVYSNFDDTLKNGKYLIVPEDDFEKNFKVE